MERANGCGKIMAEMDGDSKMTEFETIPTPKELKQAKLREALRQLEEISELDDNECDRLEAEFKARNIFK